MGLVRHLFPISSCHVGYALFFPQKRWEWIHVELPADDFPFLRLQHVGYSFGNQASSVKLQNDSSCPWKDNLSSIDHPDRQAWLTEWWIVKRLIRCSQHGMVWAHEWTGINSMRSKGPSNDFRSEITWFHHSANNIVWNAVGVLHVNTHNWGCFTKQLELNIGLWYLNSYL